jgi:hypothetical protein
MKNLVVLALALAACSDDKTNNPTPDASTPHPDAAPPIDSSPKLCSVGDPSSCAGETICIGTMCEPAFNRIYTFSGISVTVATQNPGGSAWDPLGGAPDPFVVVKLNGTSILTTANVSDVFAASYTETTDQQIVAGSTLQMTMSDADVGGDDLILDCTIDPLTADELRHAVVECDGSGPTAGSTIIIHIDVKG